MATIITTMHLSRQRRDKLMRGTSACLRHADAARGAARRCAATLFPPHFCSPYAPDHNGCWLGCDVIDQRGPEVYSLVAARWPCNSNQGTLVPGVQRPVRVDRARHTPHPRRCCIITQRSRMKDLSSGRAPRIFDVMLTLLGLCV